MAAVKLMACAICNTRRPRRFCPGVKGDICPICCGTEREVSVDCPLDCEYLRQARAHERPAEHGEADWPSKDIQVTEQFLEKNEALVHAIGGILADAAMRVQGAIDFDVREALDGLVRSYRTLQSGIIYESVPANPLAASIYRHVQEAVAAYRRAETEHGGMARSRDADVLGAIVFFQRVEFDRNNGRRRGRAFIDMLRTIHSMARQAEAPPASLLLP